MLQPRQSVWIVTFLTTCSSGWHVRRRGTRLLTSRGDGRHTCAEMTKCELETSWASSLAGHVWQADEITLSNSIRRLEDPLPSPSWRKTIRSIQKHKIRDKNSPSKSQETWSCSPSTKGLRIKSRLKKKSLPNSAICSWAAGATCMTNWSKCCKRRHALTVAVTELV